MRTSPPASGVEIREGVTPEELQAAGRVTQAAYKEFAANFIPSEWDFYALTLPDTTTRVQQGTLFIALDGKGEVVGTVTLYLEPAPTSTHWRPDDATFRFLAVLPDRRQAGIGGAMMRECINRALAAGKNRLALQTTPHMSAAIHMYQQAGFVRDIYGDQTHGSFSLLGFALVLDNRTVPPDPSVLDPLAE